MNPATLRLIAALTFMWPSLRGKVDTEFNQMDQYTASRNVPNSLVLAVCMFESGAGSNQRALYLCGVQPRTLRALWHEGVIVHHDNRNLDQLDGAAYVLWNGHRHCHTWEGAANFFRSGSCGLTGTNYGRRAITLSRQLELRASQGQPASPSPLQVPPRARVSSRRAEL